MINTYYYLALFLIFLIILSLFNIIRVNIPNKNTKEILFFPNRKIYSVGNNYRPSYYPYKTSN